MLEDCDDHGSDFAVLHDQVSYHDSVVTREEFERWKAESILNVVSFPRGNAIENFFSIVKNKYRRLRLQELLYPTGTSNRVLILKAARSVKLKTIRMIIEKCLKVWDHADFT